MHWSNRTPICTQEISRVCLDLFEEKRLNRLSGAYVKLVSECSRFWIVIACSSDFNARYNRVAAQIDCGTSKFQVQKRVFFRQLSTLISLQRIKTKICGNTMDTRPLYGGSKSKAEAEVYGSSLLDGKIEDKELGEMEEWPALESQSFPFELPCCLLLYKTENCGATSFFAQRCKSITIGTLIPTSTVKVVAGFWFPGNQQDFNAVTHLKVAEVTEIKLHKDTTMCTNAFSGEWT